MSSWSFLRALFTAAENPVIASSRVSASISPLRGRAPLGVMILVVALKLALRSGSSLPSAFIGVSLRIVPTSRSVKVSSLYILSPLNWMSSIEFCSLMSFLSFI